MLYKAFNYGKPCKGREGKGRKGKGREPSICFRDDKEDDVVEVEIVLGVSAVNRCGPVMWSERFCRDNKR